MAHPERQYECIVFGATGYTGKYTINHIARHLPTDFKWAVAGRSERKLKSLVEDLKTVNTNRVQPGVAVCDLDKNQLLELAKKTKVLITTVGPYHKYGTTVLQACAETGTHYLDVTGEVPWVLEMVQKYHDTAKKNSAIIIPQNGLESAPADLLCWALVSHIREALGVGTGEIIHTIYDINAGVSGGSLATGLGMFDHYSASELTKAQHPWSLCPVAPPTKSPGKPVLERITGVRNVGDLGTLTDSIQGSADIPIIGRSWGLHDIGNFYGGNFHVSAYMRARNAVTAFGFHLALLLGVGALMLSPFRWLLKQFVLQPGEGPSEEQSKKNFVEWRAIAHADVSDANDPKRAYGRMRFQGSMYHLTGICLAEAALTMSREKTFAHELGGGILTPSTLGAPYLERLQRAGLQTEIRMMP